MKKTVWWASWGLDTLFVVAGIFFTPIVAIVAFATGDSGTGWAALGMFAFALVYGLLLAFEVVGRSNRDQSS